MTPTEAHSKHSHRREKILENLFIGGVLRELWRRGIYDVELLQSDIDVAGYDLLLDICGNMRHIQLKAATRLKRLKVNGKISDKPSGCVIVIMVDDNLDISGFAWLGETIGSSPPNMRKGKKAKSIKRSSTGIRKERPDSFVVKPSNFEHIDNFAEIVDKLLEAT